MDFAQLSRRLPPHVRERRAQTVGIGTLPPPLGRSGPPCRREPLQRVGAPLGLVPHRISQCVTAHVVSVRDRRVECQSRSWIGTGGGSSRRSYACASAVQQHRPGRSCIIWSGWFWFVVAFLEVFHERRPRRAGSWERGGGDHDPASLIRPGRGPICATMPFFERPSFPIRDLPLSPGEMGYSQPWRNV